MVPNPKKKEANTVEYVKKNWTTLVIYVILIYFSIHTRIEYEESLKKPWTEYSGVPIDDSWIHYQYAKNLARGHGFSYNDGEPSNGSTSPLWSIILAIVYGATGFIVLPSKLIGIFFTAILSLVLYHIFLEITESRLASLAGSWFILFDPRLAWGSVSGMEIPLFVLLTYASIYVVLEYTQNHQNRAYHLAIPVCFGLVSLSRPEGYGTAVIGFTFIFLFFFGGVVLSMVKAIKNRWRPSPSYAKSNGRGQYTKHIKNFMNIILMLVVYAILVSPWIFFCLRLTGKPLPNTVYAKSAFSLDLVIGLSKSSDLYKNIIDGFKFLFTSFFPKPQYYEYMVPLGVLYYLIRKPRKMSFVFAWSVALAASFILSGTPLGIHHGRYLSYLLPAYYLCYVVGLYALSSVVTKLLSSIITVTLNVTSPLISTTTIPVSNVLPILIFFVIVANLGFHEMMQRDFEHMRGQYALNVENINTQQVEVGFWLRDNTPKNATIAVNDAGAIAFLSERRVIDIMGVTSSELWNERKNGRLLQYLKENKPEYMAIYPHWFHEINGLNCKPIYSKFAKPYNTICGGPIKIVYKCDWGSNKTYAINYTPVIGLKNEYTLLDSLDVGKQSDESNHNYSIEGQVGVGGVVFTYPDGYTGDPSMGLYPNDTGDGYPIGDDFRAHRGRESFSVKSISQRPLVLVKRIDHGIRDMSTTVFVDGVLLGVWEHPGEDPVNRWRDETFIIPKDYIKSNVTELAFVYRSGMDVNSFYYWVYVPNT